MCISQHYISVCVQQYSECYGLVPMNYCMFLCPFACMPVSLCCSLDLDHFYALKAILRVTFQKPWRAALLSVCARLCDSVWAEKAQGHISGPFPITELHSLQTILWRGEYEGTVDKGSDPVTETATVTEAQCRTSVCGLYIHKHIHSEHSHLLTSQRFPLKA